MILDDPQKFFYAADGRILKSCADLLNALMHMDDTTYFHHARSKKDNDFSKWLSEVFHQKYLAKSISLCKNRKEAVKFLFMHQFQ